MQARNMAEFLLRTIHDTLRLLRRSCASGSVKRTTNERDCGGVVVVDEHTFIFWHLPSSLSNAFS